MNGTFVELKMRFRIELILDSTVYTISDGSMLLSERFRLEARKRYKAYRTGAFSDKMIQTEI